MQLTLVGVFSPLRKTTKTKRLSSGWFAPKPCLMRQLNDITLILEKHQKHRACMSLLGHQQRQQCSVSVPHTVMTLHALYLHPGSIFITIHSLAPNSCVFRISLSRQPPFVMLVGSGSYQPTDCGWPALPRGPEEGVWAAWMDRHMKKGQPGAKGLVLAYYRSATPTDCFIRNCDGAPITNSLQKVGSRLVFRTYLTSRANGM